VAEYTSANSSVIISKIAISDLNLKSGVPAPTASIEDSIDQSNDSVNKVDFYNQKGICKFSHFTT
jgi:hypothetical protein